MKCFTIKVDRNGVYNPITIDVQKGEKFAIKILAESSTGEYIEAVRNNDAKIVDISDSSNYISPDTVYFTAFIFSLDSSTKFKATGLKWKNLKYLPGVPVPVTQWIDFEVQPFMINVHEYEVTELLAGPIDTYEITTIDSATNGKLNSKELKVAQKITIGSTELTEAQLQSLLGLLTQTVEG